MNILLKEEFTPSPNPQVASSSYVYSGTLMHQRLLPVEHKFIYSVPSFSIDLDSLESKSNFARLFAYNKFAVFSLWDSDYIDKRRVSIKQKALELVESRELREQVVKVWLVTSPRYFNYVFNPVSFYYYLDKNDKPLCWLAEVNNTFSEKHLYFINALDASYNDGSYIAESCKEFHVSPFNDMSGKYVFRFGPLGDKLDIRIDLHKTNEDGEELLHFRSSISGKGNELNHKSLRDSIAKFPLSASLNSFRIHKQAAQLYFKKNLPIFSKPVPLSSRTSQYSRSVFTKAYFALFRKLLSGIKIGSLKLRRPDGQEELFGLVGAQPEADLEVRDWSFFSCVVRGGDVAFGEAYVDGLCESSNLVALIEMAAKNSELLKGDTLLSGPKKVLDSISHRLRRNSLEKSKKNISEHYDLNNDFFSLFLDETMTYSSGVYRTETSSLHDAQLEKIRMIARKAKIEAHHHVLEIGCGWGGFSIDTVKRTGCRLTGLTLSIEQKKFAEARISEAGLEDKIEILLCDYRKIQGQFDRIISIEMLEAVGHEYLPEYFEVIQKRLVDGGRAVIQSITIPDERYDDYCRGCDWIQKYIFPGGHLPCEGVLKNIVDSLPGIEIGNIERIGLDYATTLADWREIFYSKKDDVFNLGFDEKFFRTWEYYLIYCEAGFRAKVINNIQLELFKKS